MKLRSPNVLLGYPWFYNKKFFLSIDWVNHSITFVLGGLSHFVQCSKVSSKSIVPLTFLIEYRCCSFHCCVVDPTIQYYNFNIDVNQLSYHEQHLLNLITNDFKDDFRKELPPRLPPMHNVDHKMDLILSVAPVSIPPYQLSRLEEDEIATQLKII